jgi:hypothetical protein
MKFFDRLKRAFKMLVTDPNSAEGYRMRVDYLIEQGVPLDNPLLTAYEKIANQKEKEESR